MSEVGELNETDASLYRERDREKHSEGMRMRMRVMTVHIRERGK